MAGGFYEEISFVTHILMIFSTLATILCLMTTYYLYFSTIFQGRKWKYPKFFGGWVSYKLCECLLYYHCIKILQLIDISLCCLTTKALKRNSYQKAEYSIKYISFETIEELDFLDLIWLVKFCLRQTWSSLW